MQIRVGGRLGVGKNVPVLVQRLRREHLVIAQFTCAAAAERKKDCDLRCSIISSGENKK